MIIKQLKQKTCKVCKVKFTPSRPLQTVCNFECAIKDAVTKRKKVERKEYREAKEKLKSRPEYLREAQAIFNQYIRLRDEGLVCISCQKPMYKKVNAGHYRSVGACPELRFDELNVHAQCEACNSFLSGNIVQYRINLIKKIGIEAVEYLESKHQPKHYTIDDIKKLKIIYKEKIKQLQQSQV